MVRLDTFKFIPPKTFIEGSWYVLYDYTFYKDDKITDAAKEAEALTEEVKLRIILKENFSYYFCEFEVEGDDTNRLRFKDTASGYVFNNQIIEESLYKDYYTQMWGLRYKL